MNIENITNKQIIDYLNKIAIDSCTTTVYRKDDIFPLLLALLAERMST
jgi:hypothetical protein